MSRTVKWGKKKANLNDSCLGFGTAGSRSGETLKKVSQISDLSSWVK